jgi:hypothetical protein
MLRFHHHRLAVLSCLTTAALGLAAGCSGSGPSIARVCGVVRLDGKPLSSGRVTFWPTSGRSASGWIEEDGRFTLGTFTETDGATIGPHTVTVTAASKAPPGPPDFDRDRPPSGGWPRPLVPPRYANPDASGLAFEVHPGKNAFEIELTAKVE